jgi:nitrate/nitrite-specific signal transduction histidine kinase
MPNDIVAEISEFIADAEQHVRFLEHFKDDETLGTACVVLTCFDFEAARLLYRLIQLRNRIIAAKQELYLSRIESLNETEREELRATVPGLPAIFTELNERRLRHHHHAAN